MRPASPDARTREVLEPDVVHRLLQAPNSHYSPVGGNELWLREHGISG